jgi:hypothetical protein
MIRTMANIAIECVKRPGLLSVWSETAQRYVCDKDQEFEVAMSQQSNAATQYPPIRPVFKLVFNAAVAGTLFFTLLCVGTRYAAGSTISSGLDETLKSIMDMVKITVGAIVGLLGAPAIIGEKR